MNTNWVSKTKITRKWFIINAEGLVLGRLSSYIAFHLMGKHKVTYSPNLDCGDKWYWDYVKWYDGYECVDFIESFLADCIPEEDYRLVRIGEDNDDVEERGDYWDAEIYVQRTISW